MSNPTTVIVGGSQGGVALSDLVPKIKESDLPPPTHPVEKALLTASQHPQAELLRKAMLSNVLTTPRPPGAARAVIYTATLLDTATLFKPYDLPDTSNIIFETRRSIQTLDTSLRDSYAYVQPTLGWLRQQGLHSAIEMWLLDEFMKDNAISRTTSTASMVLIDAFYRAGLRITV